MHPIILQIGPFTLYSYGLMVAIAFLSGLSLSLYRAQAYNVSKEIIYNLVFYLFISGLFGARILYVMINYADYQDSPLDILKLWQGGLVFYGGFLLSVSVGLFYLRHKRICIRDVGDILSPAIALAMGIGRIGCLLNGCCGPVQIPAAISLISLSLILLFVEKIWRIYLTKGDLFLLFLFIYSIYRFIIEYFRQYPRDYYIGIFTISQFLSIIILVVSIVLKLSSVLKERYARD